MVFSLMEGQNLWRFPVRTEVCRFWLTMRKWSLPSIRAIWRSWVQMVGNWKWLSETVPARSPITVVPSWRWLVKDRRILTETVQGKLWSWHRSTWDKISPNANIICRRRRWPGRWPDWSCPPDMRIWKIFTVATATVFYSPFVTVTSSPSGFLPRSTWIMTWTARLALS